MVAKGDDAWTNFGDGALGQSLAGRLLDVTLFRVFVVRLSHFRRARRRRNCGYRQLRLLP